MNTKLIPNTFQHPNAYIDWLAYYLTPEEEKVLNKAIREILGWHNRIEARQARIALSVFEHGKKSKETGEQLCLGCGLGRAAIRKALRSLDEHKILVRVGSATNDGQMYRIQDNYQLVDLDGLKARREEQDAKNASRTSHAREVLSDNRGVVAHNPPHVVAHNPGGIVGQTQRNPVETQIETQFTPSSGEKLPPKESESFEGLFSQPEPTPRRTSEQAVEQLQTVAGADPLSGALKALETASAKSPTVPAVAGGADPWESVALAFCGLHGLTLVDIRESDRKNWPRKLESIAETARATPAQMVKAIMALPESEYHFKSYSSPYTRSFEPDIIMLVSQMAAGIDVRAKGNGNNGRHQKTAEPAETPVLATGFRDFTYD